MGNWDNTGKIWIGASEITWTPDGGSAVYLADQTAVGREHNVERLKRRAANQDYPRVNKTTSQEKTYSVKVDDIQKIFVTNASDFALDTQGTLAYKIPGKGDAQNDLQVSVECTLVGIQMSEANADDVVEATLEFEGKYEDGSGDPETISNAA